MKITEYIRKEAGMKRPEFSRKYGIPVRTLEDWDAGKNTPPDYVINLLARALYEDKAGTTDKTGYGKGKPVRFVVYNCGKYDEAITLNTGNILEALRVCEQGEDKNYHDELWVTIGNPEDEDTSSYQFEKIEWESIDK